MYHEQLFGEVIVLSLLSSYSNIVFELGHSFLSHIFLINEKIFGLIELSESVSLTSFINNICLHSLRFYYSCLTYYGYKEIDLQGC